MKINRRKFIKASTLTTTNLALLNMTGNAGVLTNIFNNDVFGLFHTESQLVSDLQKDFIIPPDSAKPSCYWWWFNSLVNKKGITRDLEELRAKGMGGVLLMASGNVIISGKGVGVGPMPNGPKFLSPEWLELYRHALNEASRLSLEVGVNMTTGWDMGGPWIKPENSGRWFLQSKLTVTGPKIFSGLLPLPGNKDGYVYNPKGSVIKSYIDLPLDQLDYRDTAVIAFPEQDGEGSLLTGERLQSLPAKSNRLDAGFEIRANAIEDPPLVPWESSPADKPLSVSQVTDLTGKMTADGHLEWRVPEGRWTILRTGHRMTGARTHLPLPGADGPEVDWLSEAGVNQQFDNLGKLLLTEAGPLTGKTLKYFHDDSFEDGFPNWNITFLDNFKNYRGYDARPYLPVFAGRIVESAEASDRFLYDYRKTVADCMADGHYKRFADLTHEHGLLVQNESAGPAGAGTMCMDGLKNLGRSDQPMGEFWLGKFIQDEQNQYCKIIASASHIYGKKTASAESFTSVEGHWINTPAILKPIADRAFCEGINRCVIHTSTATRPEDGKPGYEYFAGTHFNRKVTWWDKSGAFLTYLGRCQYLLQTGLFVADVLYYNGDWAPNLVEPKHVDPSLGKGYDYDVCNAEVLLTRLSVKDGRIVLPDGMSYRLLVLPESKRMPVAIVNKIKELVNNGATVVGPRPDQDPGLQDYPQCDKDVKDVSEEVWGACDGKEVKQNNYGKGHIFWGVALRDILLAKGIKPDFEHTGAHAFIDFIHRTTDETEMYFIANRNNRTEKVECNFRVSGRQPEIWDPVSGEMRNADSSKQAEGITMLPFELLPYQSFFVVFNKNKEVAKAVKPAALKNNFPKLSVLQQIEGPWTVKFDPKWGGPKSVEFASLQDWAKRPEEGIKYYSGTALYVKHFDLKKEDTKHSGIFLDLGEVKEIAEVKLNGKKLGIVWTNPWRVDITNVVRPANNSLEIEIVNLWPNRLIGDAALPPEKRLTHTNIEYKKDAPLLSSGLLGPVTIRVSN